MTLNSIGSFFIFLLVLSGLVFVHELGHFLAARRFGIHIEEFGIGFPPRLLGVVRDATGKLRWFTGRNAPKKAELGAEPRTVYTLNAIPLGGFVRPVGEDDPSVPGGLAGAPKRARVVVLAAGAGFNLLFGFLIFVLGFRLGWPDRVNITRVADDSPAQRAGLAAADVILRANGEEIHYSQQIVQIVHDHLGQPVELLVQRAGETLTLSITPRTEWPEGQGPMGIELGLTLVKDYTWPQAVGRAAQEMAYQFEVLIHLPGQIIAQKLPAEAARPCGPVCLNDLTREAVAAAQTTNEWFPIIQLVGLVSVALATTNLLPLPALDGGRILFVLIEAIRGKRVDPMRESMVHLMGMALLLMLMVVITIQDIRNPIIPR